MFKVPKFCAADLILGLVEFSIDIEMVWEEEEKKEEKEEEKGVAAIHWLETSALVLKDLSYRLTK